nr:helix-turn-helix transcriptional regulator [uncultured Desulfobulbus sp.]
MAFKDRIKEIRKELGLTQKEMADKIGVSLRTQQRYEEGSKAPEIHLLIDLALIGYNLHWLITGDGHKRLKPKPEENSYLKEIEIWLEEEINKDHKVKDWFKVQFEIAFPTFKEWRQKR